MVILNCCLEGEGEGEGEGERVSKANHDPDFDLA